MLSSATVRHFAQVFSLLTTTVKPSIATGNSINSTPAFLQSSASFDLIGRDALEMSVSPEQNFLKPPPVPLVPTGTFTPGLDFAKSSATALLIGATVLEPSIVIFPDRFDGALAGSLAGSFIAVVAAGVVAPVVVGLVSLPPLQDASVAASVTPATKVTTLRLIFFLDIIGNLVGTKSVTVD